MSDIEKKPASTPSSDESDGPPPSAPPLGVFSRSELEDLRTGRITPAYLREHVQRLAREGRNERRHVNPETALSWINEVQLVLVR